MVIVVVVVIAQQLLLSSVVQVEEVCDRGRVVPSSHRSSLWVCRMALTVEQMVIIVLTAITVIIVKVLEWNDFYRLHNSNVIDYDNS